MSPPPNNRSAHTNKRQPNKLQADKCYNGQQHPQHRLRIQRQPKEPLIRRIDLASSLWIQTLKDPAAVSGVGVDFVPPAESDEAASRNVLEVVEVRGEQEDCGNEDQDEVIGEEDAEEVGQRAG